MSTLDLIAAGAFGMSVLSFVAFVFFAVRALRPATPAPSPQLGQGLGADLEQHGLNETLEAMAKLIEATSKLADSLAKAGPLVATLVASILFLAFALIAASASAAAT